MPVIEPHRVGALLHVYYPELLPAMIDRLRHLPATSTVLVSTPPEHVDTVAGAIREAMPRVRLDCRGVPNAGRDIGPMLVEFAADLLGLDLVCKLHSKRTFHHGNRDAWREYLYDNLVESRAAVEHTIALFERHVTLGALFPSAQADLRAWMGWDPATLRAVQPLCRSIGVEPLLIPDFPAGSMYWFRPRALARLLSRRWTWDDFQVEGKDSRPEGRLEHGVERIVTGVLHADGYTWRKCNTVGGRRRAADSFRNESGAGIAVVLHVWSLDGVMSVLAALKNLAFEFDLLVSVSQQAEDGLRRLLRQHFPETRAQLFRVANAGHDIGPFLALGDRIREYALACKLHVKSRSPEWLAYLLENLSGGIAEVNSILAMFARDPKLGIVYPRTFPPALRHMEWGANHANASAVCNRLGLPPPDPRGIEFPAGSMFWFRPASLDRLMHTGATLPFDERDNAKADGALSHAVERLFVHVAQCAGYRSRQVLFHPYRGPADLEVYEVGTGVGG